MAEAPIVQTLRVSGDLLLRIDGTDELHVVGRFDQPVEVSIIASQYKEDIYDQIRTWLPPQESSPREGTEHA